MIGICGIGAVVVGVAHPVPIAIGETGQVGDGFRRAEVLQARPQGSDNGIDIQLSLGIDIGLAQRRPQLTVVCQIDGPFCTAPESCTVLGIPDPPAPPPLQP